MIHFVVCDDERAFRKSMITVIDRVMMSKDDIEYNVVEFDDYNKPFEEFIKEPASSKIYILDIELKGAISGIDIARQIRLTDWDSIILMVTSHSELGYEALQAQIMLLDFISKYNDCEKKLYDDLRKAVAKVDKKKTLAFDSFSITHRVYLDDILWIEKDTVDRKCIIKTTYSTFTINKTMTEMVEVVDDRFCQSHRSCIVNLDHIRNINWKDSIINFKNGEKCQLLSRDKKKGLRERVKGYEYSN